MQEPPSPTAVFFFAGRAYRVAPMLQRALQHPSARQQINHSEKHAGKSPTRASFVSGLESAGTIDLGGLDVRYSPNIRKGSNYVELTVVGPSVTFVK
ncbi:hypothetical protein ACUXPM_000921 [Ralstonia sp. 151470066-2]